MDVPLSLNTRAHPRVCGEHHPGCDCAIVPSGSSPRLRGARARRQRKASLGGLIPASAGSTGQRLAYHQAAWAHPRVCGEHRHRVRRRVSRCGSSPRLRGALTQHEGPNTTTGLIPASAGSTMPVRDIPAAFGAHPRVCGEHTKNVSSITKTGGSSPRLRGALVVSIRRGR